MREGKRSVNEETVKVWRKRKEKKGELTEEGRREVTRRRNEHQ